MGARHVGFRLGLVDKEEPPRIDRRLTRLPPLTPPADVRPVLFGGAKAFFERHAFMLKKMPKRVIVDRQAAVGQLLKQKRAARGPASRRSAKSPSRATRRDLARQNHEGPVDLDRAQLPSFPIFALQPSGA
jgi:hypothetical protein